MSSRVMGKKKLRICTHWISKQMKHKAVSIVSDDTIDKDSPVIKRLLGR